MKSNLDVIVKVDSYDTSGVGVLNDYKVFFVYGHSHDMQTEETHLITLAFAAQSQTDIDKLRGDFRPDTVWACSGTYMVSYFGITMWEPKYEQLQQEVIDALLRDKKDDDLFELDEVKEIVSKLSL